MHVILKNIDLSEIQKYNAARYQRATLPAVIFFQDKAMINGDGKHFSEGGFLLLN